MKGTIRIMLGMLCFIAAGGANDSMPLAQFALVVGSFGLAGALLVYSGAQAAEAELSR